MLKTKLLIKTLTYVLLNFYILCLGNPEAPAITSGVLSDSESSYRLVWKEQPNQNISAYQILYRKLPVSNIEILF